MKQYLKMLTDIVTLGQRKEDRTGTGTISIFGYQTRYNLASSFPLLTTKKVNLKPIIYELLWFLKGDTNIKYLNEHGVHIWDKWADKDGELGPIYGKQWRSWETADGKFVDQLRLVVDEIKKNPNSRRLIVSAWNPGEIEAMALPPCHLLFQFYVTNNQLSCQLYQRSADVFLGVPFNIASYALLTMMVAQVCNLQAKELVHTFGDLHIYLNHQRQILQQISRSPRDLPKMTISPRLSIDDYQYDDFVLSGYNPYPPIPGEISV